MAPILYKMDASPPARTAIMVADLLGLELEFRDLHPLLREQDKPEFVKKNPMRTIPILEDGDFCLADSHAIAIYFLEKYGKKEHEYLYPKDERKRATINHRLFFDCGILFPRLREIMVHDSLEETRTRILLSVYNTYVSQGEMNQAPTYSGRMTEIPRYNKLLLEDAYKILETYLTETLYLADDEMTVADICAVTTTSTLDGLHPVNGKRFPKVKQWLKTMSEKDVCNRINENGYKMQVYNLKAIMEINKENQEEKKKLKSKV